MSDFHRFDIAETPKFSRLRSGSSVLKADLNYLRQIGGITGSVVKLKKKNLLHFDSNKFARSVNFKSKFFQKPN